MTNANEELEDFQKKVSAEYQTLKSLKKSSARIKEDRAKENKGCLSIPIFIFAEFAIKKAFEGESRKKNYDENEREAKELLEQKEISDKVCETITATNRSEILTEDKFVDSLTAALYKSDLASRFVIPENAVLYAMMATEIYETGLEEFCSNRKGDK